MVVVVQSWLVMLSPSQDPGMLVVLMVYICCKEVSNVLVRWSYRGLVSDGGGGEVIIAMSDVVEELRDDGNWKYLVRFILTERINYTNSCEQHIIKQESDGHYDEDKFPGLSGRVEIRPDSRPGHILRRLRAHLLLLPEECD